MTTGSRFGSALILSLVLSNSALAGSDGIAPGQGEILLAMLDGYGMSATANAGELVFHLCDLAAPLLEDESQREKVQSLRTSLAAMRPASKDGPAIDTAVKRRDAATHLILLAAAQIVVNLMDGSFDGESYDFASPEELEHELPGLPAPTEGYRLQIVEVVSGHTVAIEAVEITFTDGPNFFLCFTLDNGIPSLRSGFSLASDRDCYGPGTQSRDVWKWESPSR